MTEKALYINYVKEEHKELLNSLNKKNGLLFINSVVNVYVDDLPYFHGLEILHFKGEVIATCPITARYLCEMKTPNKRSYYLDDTNWGNMNAKDNCKIFNTLDIICSDEDVGKTIRKIFNSNFTLIEKDKIFD